MGLINCKSVNNKCLNFKICAGEVFYFNIFAQKSVNYLQIFEKYLLLWLKNAANNGTKIVF